MALVKLNNRGVRSATTFGSITGLGSMVFIKKLTASGSATLSFVDGTSDVVLDDTYKEYLFTFNNIHPSYSTPHYTRLTFNMSIDSGSNYNIAKTTTFFRSQHGESGTGGELGYEASLDLAQGTGFQPITQAIGDDNDNSASGYLRLFNPSSTTFVKHFMATSSNVWKYSEPYGYNSFIAGYGNTTSAVDAIQFKMANENIDAGDICLYGIN